MLKPVHVEIENFQSIKSLKFDINGFTCITGKTNIGKSSILRAISSAISNRPVINFVRKGHKSCSVMLQSNCDVNPWGFEWEKFEKGSNKYKILGKNETLENTGSGQLSHVTEMGFRGVQINEKEL